MRKTIYFGKKDPELKKLIEQCEDYLVSDMVKTLMKDGLRYRELLEGRRVVELPTTPSTVNEPAPIIEEKPLPKPVEEVEEDDDFTIDLSDIEIENDENDEKEEDSTDLYNKLSQC